MLVWTILFDFEESLTGASRLEYPPSKGKAAFFGQEFHFWRKVWQKYHSTEIAISV
jgi:hypothetical protein